MNNHKTHRLHDEPGRLSALRRFQIVDAQPEKEFTEIASLTRLIFRVQFAEINVIDSDRQWTKATSGHRPGVIDRRNAFCNYTLRATDYLAVADATEDSRFCDNPFVTGEAHIRSYLGVPLTTSDGYNIGSLCVFDTRPRSFTAAEAEILSYVAKVVMSQLELRLIARWDSLTGTLTRRAFQERMDLAMAETEPVTLMLLDLDHFKSINDTFGHRVGDVVLQQIASILQETLHETGFVGRLGGEEFGVLLKTSLKHAETVAETLREIAEVQAIPDLGGRRITLSIGIAPHIAGELRDSWMERADQALYVAKHSGRNRCCVVA